MFLSLAMFATGATISGIFLVTPINPHGHIQVISGTERDTLRYINLTSGQTMTKSFTGNLTLSSPATSFVWQYNGPASLTWYEYVELYSAFGLIAFGLLIVVGLYWRRYS